MKPMWAEIEAATPELQTEYYDADENSEVLEKYGVEDIPVFIFLDKEGKEIMRLKGAQNKDFLMEKVREYLDK